ncbi:13E12 repeat family protein [Mycolicibacterium brumae]|uniref:13E12 repeat family protein n=1 Tax=Mycolicibacterium brumae TaxID=85968 RepID=UPI000FE223E1|nr:13E12 repeat family protein [Mycolicibacterium brumae]RWA21623.1 hypothetical protein MBRU_14200 [Mycolicibacterium brumae DSM 44177]
MSTATLPPPPAPAGGDGADDGGLIARLTGHPVDRAGYRDALVRFEDAAAALAALSAAALTPADTLAVLERAEVAHRGLAVLTHRLIGHLQSETPPTELGAKSWTEVLAQRLRCSRGEARHRINDTHTFGLRHTLTGDVLEPLLPEAAAAIADGRIGPEHTTILRDFTTHLPTTIDPSDRCEALRQLAHIAADYTPEQTRQYAHRLMSLLHPDGVFTDAERARRRGIHLGAQDHTGMSPITGRLTPEARAVLDAVLAKLAAPGMANPENTTPCLDGTPTEEHITTDTRDQRQRNHDALLAAGRALLASGKLGQHNGLPVSVVITTTLQDLTDATGHGLTSSGALIPMREVIRNAAHAWNYLAVFDKHTNIPLYLGRSKRLATPGQRIMLTARDRGCTFPACTTPANRCEVHHTRRVADQNGQTNADEMTLTCPGNHRMANPRPHQYSAHINQAGQVEWTPPPHLDTGAPRVNTYHHPERLLPRNPKSRNLPRRT